jgi:hypothetical protein
MKDEILPGYVRVSTVLAQDQDFSHIDKTVFDAKTDLGSRVHNAIEMFLEDKEPSLDPKAQAYYDSFLRWHATVKPTIVFQEQRYYDHDKKFTGKVDAVIKMPYEKIPVLIDWKTSAVENTMIWTRQGHFYHHLLLKNGVTFVADRVLFCKLDPRGGFPKVSSYTIDPDTTNYCLSLVDKYWEKEKNLVKK